MAEEFPRRWSEPQFKQPKTLKVERFTKRHALDLKEEDAMRRARARDQRCRFPLCGCGRIGIVLDVSHKQHRGMGGNPAGDRTEPEKLILVCRSRHRQNRVSIDRGTLRWTALTARGSDGPITWDLDLRAIRSDLSAANHPIWIELARERNRGEWEPFTIEQAAVLKALRGMEL